MAAIAIDVPGISGECQLEGYRNLIEAMGISDAIFRPPSSLPSGRGMSVSLLSPVCVKRYRDSANPLISNACAGMQDLGEVKIYLFRILEGDVVPFLEYEISSAFITHVQYSTDDAQGNAWGPHLLDDPTMPQPGTCGVGEPAMAPRRVVPYRPTTRPVAPSSSMSYTDGEVERVWIMGGNITWSYHEYVNGTKTGTTSKAWSFFDQG